MAAAGLLHAPARAGDPVAAGRLVAMIYTAALYESEIDRLLLEADHKSVFGTDGNPARAQARDRALTRASLLGGPGRDAVLRAAGDRVALLATDAQLATLLRVGGQPGAPADAAVDGPSVDAAVGVVKRGFAEAAVDHLVRFARGNANLLCRDGERSFCP